MRYSSKLGFLVLVGGVLGAQACKVETSDGDDGGSAGESSGGSSGKGGTAGGAGSAGSSGSSAAGSTSAAGSGGTSGAAGAAGESAGGAAGEASGGAAGAAGQSSGGSSGTGECSTKGLELPIIECPSDELNLLTNPVCNDFYVCITGVECSNAAEQQLTCKACFDSVIPVFEDPDTNCAKVPESGLTEACTQAIGYLADMYPTCVPK